MVAAGSHTHCHVCLHGAEATLQAVWLTSLSVSSLSSTNTHLSKQWKKVQAFENDKKEMVEKEKGKKN